VVTSTSPRRWRQFHDSDRTAELHRAWIRERVGVVRDMKQARNLTEQAIYDAMQTEGNPAGRRLRPPEVG
jgi:hypothetical protein